MRSYCDALHCAEVTAISVEPAVSAQFRRAGITAGLLPLQTFLRHHQERLPQVEARDGRSYRLFGHCTERAILQASSDEWHDVFAAAGLELDDAGVGCCGMAGLFGHMEANVGMSRAIFEKDWQRALVPDKLVPLATGFSCRDQIARFWDAKPRHPVEVLAGHCARRLHRD
ncbi:hypothetical protein [uncultured Nitratireductor sp.]|uniref:hypothetical protein n=1 Tax=uncultured Nitratireductor sp. TaxID=520953 RepID=UPI0025E77F2D|nr:hypothetical protein [uncultured Nitratireductor sp.]